MSGDNENKETVDTKMSVASSPSDDESIDGTEENEGENLVFDQEKASQALALMVCTVDGVPPQVVKDHAFSQLIHTLNPFAQLGSVKTVKAECLKIYKEERLKAMEILSAFDGQISLSVDILKNLVGIEYVCVTAHFIDDSWKLKKWVLRLRCLWDEDEDEDDFFIKVLLKSISNWDIESKISTITLKSSSEYDTAVKMLQDCVQEKRKLQLNSQLFRVHCCADMLSLMVKDALNEIPKINEEVLGLVACGKPFPEPFWHLTHHTLKEVAELYSTGEFSKKDYCGIEIPSADDWKKVKGIVKLLDSIYNVAKCLFESKYSTANIYLHNLQQLRASLIQESTGSDSFIKPLAEKMLQKFDKYWKEMFLVLAITTVLDPRFKMKYFEFASSKYEDNSQAATVLESIRSLYNEYPTHCLESQKSTSDSTSFDFDEEFSDSEDSSGHPRKLRRIEEERVEEGCGNSNNGFNWLQEYNQFIGSNDQPPKSELDFYLEEPVKPWIQDFDVLKWWKASSPKYPTLSKMARDFLAVPLSVVTSFGAYHTEGREIERDLLRSGRDVMEALMCTRSWKKKN